MNANPNESNWKALAPSMEANMMTIRHPAAETAEHSARSSLDAFERRPHQTALRRTKAPHRFPLHPLHGDERRAGKTAKLLDLQRSEVSIELYAAFKFLPGGRELLDLCGGLGEIEVVGGELILGGGLLRN